MDSRLLLQIVLGVIVTLIVVVGSLIIYQLTRDASTQVVEKIVEEDNSVGPEANPWSLKGDAAIALVKRVEHRRGGEERDEEGEETSVLSISAALEEPGFVKETLGIRTGTPLGWRAEWWGETEFGPSFFLVKYAFQDASIEVGPSWLVDLKSQRVVAKDVLAQVVEDPAAGRRSEYYDKERQVVSAITNHRFDSGLNLGGALLLYFEKRTDTTDEDEILGWTIVHDRGSLFEAYFQWEQDGDPTYAHFVFDYDRKALRAVNLQAADIMRAGEVFEASEPATIMPGSYDPKARRKSRRWKGPARRACRKRENRKRCSALATILQNDALIESFEWLLTAQAGGKAEFDRCKEKRNCRWVPKAKGDDEYRIVYVYNVEKESRFDPSNRQAEWTCPLTVEEEGAKQTKASCVAWDINVESGEIDPVDPTSALAYWAIHPRR